jgi:hypothetical protein
MVGGHGAVEAHGETTSHEAPSAHADTVNTVKRLLLEH